MEALGPQHSSPLRQQMAELNALPQLNWRSLVLIVLPPQNLPVTAMDRYEQRISILLVKPMVGRNAWVLSRLINHALIVV